jgi:hypothetical protein
MEPLQTLLLDTEQGSITVRDLVKTEWSTVDGKRTSIERNPKGHVTIEHTPDLKTLEDAYWRIKRGQYDPMPQVVVIDTLTALAGTHRHNVIFKRTGITLSETNRVVDKMMQLGSSQADWGTASDNLIMILRQFRGLPIVTIFNCHERLREDESNNKEKKLGPALNAMLLSDVLDFTDAGFRLSTIDTKTSVEGKFFEKGTRFLRMTQSENHFTKIRVAPGQPIPELLPDPSLWKVKDVMKDFFPNRFVIFGTRGAGKTRFAATFSDPKLLPATK